MSIIDLINLFKEIKDSIEKTIIGNKKLKTKLDRLLIRRKGKNIQFYRRIPGVTKAQYIPISDTKTLKELAENTYEIELKKAAEDELSVLDKCLLLLSRCSDVTEVYDNLPNELKALVDSNLPEEQYAREWQSIKYQKNPRATDNEFITSRGEHVRSKAEWMIAEKLNAAGIPYHYEVAFETADEDLFYPDFYILNKRTGKVFIWEHMGMMDDEGYRKRNIKKIELYAKSGWVIGKNLIVTFECKDVPLTTTMIDTIIKEILL